MTTETTTYETIRQARLCSKCRYNLYGLARAGTCPECGQQYKRRRQDEVEKNPRRQLGQFRRILRRRERDVRWLPAWWLVASCGLIACFVFEARRGWWILAILTTLVTSVRHLIAMFEYKDAKRKIQALDARRPAG